MTIGVGTLGVAFDAMKEQAEVGLGFVIGSASAAKDMVAELVAFATNNPIPVGPLIEAARFMAGVGVEAEKIVPILSVVADATAALGGSEAVFNRIAYAIQQIIAKGRLQAEEVRQLANAGVPALQILAEKSGQTQAQILKDMKTGSLSIDSVGMLLDGIREKFQGALAAQAETLNGMITIIRNYIQTWAGVAAMPIFEEIKRQARELLEVMRSPDWTASAQTVGAAVAEFLSRFDFTAIILGIAQLVSAFAKGVDEIGGWLSALVQMYEGHRTATAMALTSIAILWTLIFGPAGPIILVLGSLIVFLGAWEGDWEKFFAKLPEPVADAAMSVVRVVAGMFDGIEKLWNINRDIWADILDVVGAVTTFKLGTGDIIRNRTFKFTSEAVLGGSIDRIQAARDAAAESAGQRKWAVPDGAPSIISPGDDPNRWKSLYDGLATAADGMDKAGKAAKSAAAAEAEAEKLRDQTNKEALKASAWLAEQTFAAAEAMAKAKEKLEQWAMGELQKLAANNTRFAPGVFEQMATNAGLRPIGDFPAWVDGKQVNSAFDDQGNKITVDVQLGPDLQLAGVQ